MNIEKFGVAVKCIIKNKKKEVLLLQKTEEEKVGDVNQNLYDLPGGRVKYGEDFIEAIHREVKEETNLSVDNVKIISANKVMCSNGLHLAIVGYECFASNCKVTLSYEHKNFCWISIEKILMSNDIPTWIKEMARLLNDI